MEDIEDLNLNGTNNYSRISKNYVISHSNNKKKQERKNASINSNYLNPLGHFLPGENKIFLKTWGCSHNNSDSEYMAGILSSQGYELIFSDVQKMEADLWILNSCTVKNPSEQTFINSIKEAQQSNKKLIVCGCVPQADPTNLNWFNYSTVGVQQIDRVVEVVEETLKGNTVKLTDSNTKRNALQMPKIRKNPFIEIIPINTGCLSNCTYCKTKHARGDLGSYPVEDIISQVRRAIDEGVVEIWLTSEDTGAYGKDIGESLSSLLAAIVSVLEEYYLSGTQIMLRVGMTNPPYILAQLESIVSILNHPQVYKFLHLPVQSGSNKVLNEMKRGYTRNDFCTVVEYLKEHVHGISIATDVICGFPTETEHDHKETLSIIEKYRFPAIHISQFYPRKGTPAASMPQLQRTIIKDRSREVTKLFNSYSDNDIHVGKTLKVLFTEETTGKDDYSQEDDNHIQQKEACWLGHDEFYHQVLVKKKSVEGQNLLGCVANVLITSCGKFYLMGEIDCNSKIKKANNRALESAAIERKRPQLLNKKTKSSSKELLILTLISAMIGFILYVFQQ